MVALRGSIMLLIPFPGVALPKSEDSLEALLAQALAGQFLLLSLYLNLFLSLPLLVTVEIKCLILYSSFKFCVLMSSISSF